MHLRDLVKRSLFYYWRSNLAVVAGVATAVAVLAGALLVGDSVRSSLRQLVLNRLGATDEVITAPGFFRAELADDLEKHSEFGKGFRAGVPLITLEGVATHDQTKRRAGGVLIYGIDKRFFDFHGLEEAAPAGNAVLISPGLATELAALPGETLLLRIEKPSAIPAESLHGRKEDTGLTLRADVRATLDAASLGEFSLEPQQTAVRAVFLPIERLQRTLEQDGKVNTILLARLADGQSSENAIAVARKALGDSLALSDFGLRTRVLENQGCISLESEGAVINNATADRAGKAAEAANLSLSPVLTYLANTLRIGDRRIPYSLVTALEPRDYERLKNGGRSNLEHPLLLNQWAAADLQARTGEKVSLDYYVWREEGALAEATADFEVDGIIPLDGGLADDRNYAPEYPGITEARSLHDWDPPFPVDLSLVRPLDEEYWDKYRTTPKAFVLLADGERLWSTRYGSLTSVRLFPRTGEDLSLANESFIREMRASLNPIESGFTIYSARAQGLSASQGATDFGEYFTYFSFFIVVSALLLAALFFRLGIEQRLREIGTLSAVGFGSGAIRNLFLREGAALAVAGSFAGALGAVLYGWLMVFGLRTWWVGAVGTTALQLHVSGWSLAIGIGAGILTAIICIVLTLRSLTSVSPRSLLAGTIARVPKKVADDGVGKKRASVSYYHLASVGAGVIGVVLLVAGWLKLIGQAAGFFGAGTLFLIAMIVSFAYWLSRDRRALLSGQGWWAVARLGFRNATFRPGRSVLCIALIGASTFIIVSVDAFRREASSTSFEPRSGTGGYALIGESLVPIVHNTNSEDGRASLNLASGSGELDGAEFTRFRLRPGDDASCLNLYQPRNPRILGAPADFIRKGRFAFQGSLAKTSAEADNPWLLIDGLSGNDVIPVIADANSLTYVLHLKVGDETVISGGDGSAIRLLVVAALSDSILQGELIMSEANFVRVFPKEEGFRFFLIDAPPAKSGEVSAFLEDRLSDYGFDATETGARLAAFHQVENTYLSTFQTLGGLGLLLGTVGLAAVLVRNVIERRRELALLRAVGFRSLHFATMVLAENFFLLAAGLATGFFCAVVAILPALIARGGQPPFHALLLLALVLVTGLAASIVAVRAAFRAPLLPALRGE